MQSSDVPSRFPIPFGNAAGGSYIRTIPEASQIGIQDGAASLTDGFPPLNFTPVGAGGVPPFGQDFNGLMKQVTQWSRWQAAGNATPWDSAFSTAIGGYPKGAVVVGTSGGLWLSEVENNTTNPNTGGAGWAQLATVLAVQSGASNFSIAGGTANALTVTLSPAPTSLPTGMKIQIQTTATNTGAATLNVNGLGVAQITTADGDPLNAGDIPNNSIITVVRYGTIWRLASVSYGEIAHDVQSGIWNYAVAGGTANAITATLSPVPTALTAGLRAVIKLTATNTGAVTLNVNGLGAVAATRLGGSPLEANDLITGGVFEFEYDGTQWQVLGLNPSIIPLRSMQSFIASQSWTVPAGVFSIRARGWGAGGGGGGSGAGGCGGGGGGGAYNEGIFAVTPGQVLTLTVGSPGTVGTAGGGNGGTGGTTSIAGMFVSAGGVGGTGAASGYAGGGAGGLPTTPASASLPGQAGGRSWAFPDPLNSGATLYVGGTGGGSFGSGPTNPAFGSFGIAGWSWGTGGGGGAAGNAGGAGNRGQIILEW